jgi:hypothetical protein
LYNKETADILKWVIVELEVWIIFIIT